MYLLISVIEYILYRYIYDVVDEGVRNKVLDLYSRFHHISAFLMRLQ